MSGQKIFIVTSAEMPKSDLDSELLILELADLGINAEIAVWSDENVDWSSAEVTLLRTPWDYFYRPQEFLSWARRVDKVTKLINPLEIIEWNIHKKYLLDLEKSQVPIVPTKIILSSITSSLGARLKNNFGKAENILEIISDFSSEELILKPAISGGSIGIFKGKKDDPQLLIHAKEILKNHDLLIQPFIENITKDGEFSLIYFNREFSHAIRKLPADQEFRVQEKYGGTIELYNPTSLQLEIATRAINSAPAKAIYARVDLIRYKNSDVIMELEIIEPELFLKNSKEGIKRLAHLIKINLS